VAQNLAEKLIASHLAGGAMQAGSEIALRIDQVLQQDATGTLVMLEIEALGLQRSCCEVAVQYVDHNLLQTDSKNMDDHLFLQSAAARFGYWFSPPGNGISHVVHMERFGRPGKSLLGSDSHTCAGGALGMLAIGTGGIDVALASAGEPYFVTMPKILGIELRGELAPWVSAKNVILELLRRFGVSGGRGFIVEYFGEGLGDLSAWDRHVIANMGAELGATSSVFPSDDVTRRFLASQGREADWTALVADDGARYDRVEQIDLGAIEPLVALPGSPGDVVPVREVAGLPVSQVVVGSSANPGLRDFRIVAHILNGGVVAPGVSLDVNPSSRQVLLDMSASGTLGHLVAAGARIHQTGCMGCIGMGQAPATGAASLRTMPRNFPGRSGTPGDQVYLCSPETAAASALTGRITDPRELARRCSLTVPCWAEPARARLDGRMLLAPNGAAVELRRGPNIKPLPTLDALPDRLEIPVLLKMGDDVSTDEILRAGGEALPLRSNIPAISKFVYSAIDPDFHERARESREQFGGFCVVAGENFAQGSSREHAALAPRYLGQRFVMARSYARIGRQNLINFGIVPFELCCGDDWWRLEQRDVVVIEGLHAALRDQTGVVASVPSKGLQVALGLPVTERQARILLAGGLINDVRNR
jgi:aconitate hydratase